MAKFLEYVPGDSFLHRMNPSVKLICAVLFAIACFATSNLAFLLVLLVGSPSPWPSPWPADFAARLPAS